MVPMRTLASAVRAFSTMREYWFMPTAASIPTMMMTIMSSTRVKDLVEDVGGGVKPLLIYLFFLLEQQLSLGLLVLIVNLFPPYLFVKRNY